MREEGRWVSSPFKLKRMVLIRWLLSKDFDIKEGDLFWSSVNLGRKE